MRREQKQKIGAWLRRVLYRGTLACMVMVTMGALFFVWMSYEHFFYETKKCLIPQVVDFSYDHIYSQTIGTELSAFVHQKTTIEQLVDFKPQLFAAAVKKKFPCIKQVIVARPTPHKLCISMTGAKPCLRFSNGMLLAHKPCLFKQELFADYGLEKLPLIELTQSFTACKISKDLYGMFSKIPLWHWKKYRLQYDSPKKMYVRPAKSELCYACVIDRDSLGDHKKLAQAERLYDQLSASLQPTKKRNTMFIFDLRFADRIFISQQKGGGSNEYHYAV